MTSLESIFKRRRSIPSSRHPLPSPDLFARAPAAPHSHPLSFFLPRKDHPFLGTAHKASGKRGKCLVPAPTQVTRIKELQLQGQPVLEKPPKTPLNPPLRPGASEITVKGLACFHIHCLPNFGNIRTSVPGSDLGPPLDGQRGN